MSEKPSGLPEQMPEGFRLIYQGEPLLPFYAAEMLRPYLGRTVWVMDDAGRTRCGEMTVVPNLREDRTENIPPVEFADERPLYLRRIVCMAYYEPPR